MSPEHPSLDDLRYAFASLEDGPPRGETCPVPEDIWDALHGQLSPDAARAVVRHTAICPRCASEWRLAMTAAHAGGSRGSKRHLYHWGALAAAAALVVLAAVAVRQGAFRAPSPPEYRATQEATIRSLVPEHEPLRRERVVLRWSGLEDGTRYSIDVATQDLTPLASARELTEPEYVVPQDAVARLGAGEALVWHVEARLPDGRRIASVAFVHRIE